MNLIQFLKTFNLKNQLDQARTPFVIIRAVATAPEKTLDGQIFIF